jgi:exodeoxyribonuclease VII large subunit
LFAEARKRPLPVLPRKIGVVTSLDGAAVRDIIKVLARRYPNAHIVVRPTRVQGEGAAADIARGLRAVARISGVDVIIVGRGGGSIEDLRAFNEEAVARAIAASPVPVISAVGHEVDVTIADFVADVRAPTPSAAADIVVSRRDDFCARLDRLSARLLTGARTTVTRLDGRVSPLTRRPAMAGYAARVALRGRHAAELTHHLHDAAKGVVRRRHRASQDLRLQLEQLDLRRQLSVVGNRLVAGRAALDAVVRRRQHRAEARLQGCAARLDSLSPLAVLGRGYAVCWDETRTKVIRRAEEVSAGDRVRVTLRDGELGCTVERRGG